MKLRVGTRRSPLAVTQTKQALSEIPGDHELLEITSTGDRILDRPLRESGGKGLFVKELDDALLRGDIDCAVHSLKDVPSDLAPGVRIGAILSRGDPRDVLVTRQGYSIADLPAGARVGTTSLRRSSQLLALNEAVEIGMARGNVQTRLGKLESGEFDAIFLARAGLDRLGLDPAPAIAVLVDPDEIVPAPGQGTLAITVREDDEASLAAVGVVDHEPTRWASEAERALARVFGGGCHLPLAAYASEDGDMLRIVGLVCSPDGRRLVRDSATCKPSEAEAAGYALGRRLLDSGGAEIVRAVEEAES